MTITMERPVGTEIRAKRATKKAGCHRSSVTQYEDAASRTKTSEGAIVSAQPRDSAPLAGSHLDAGLTAPVGGTFSMPFPFPDAAALAPQPITETPHQEPHLTVDTLPAYAPDPTLTPVIDQIVVIHRERQSTIKAKTKLILQAKALLRSNLCGEADYEDDTTRADTETATGERRRKLTKSAAKRIDLAYAGAKADPLSETGMMLNWYFVAIAAADERQTALERMMVRLAKRLPAYEWAKSVRGFGDVSFATIVGECGDIGGYKSIAAVWKRLGLAVMNGSRQGNPGAGASAQDWVDHGYSPSRRSVSWNARQQVIGGMGMWRPGFGEDVRSNPALTEYQCVYAERARYEAEKLGLPVTASDRGKESYKMHVANRAHRYVEKRLIKHLYLAWRRAA